ncbi:MAG: extracellular solute-binding protein [Treponema sp.]|nr:extracellular solute-binding protein [Treponema sp.]
MRIISKQRPILPLLLAWAALSAVSCSSGRNKTAILWSDRPEFAFYGEYFNAVQDQYKIETRYYDFPAQKLKENVSTPDIVAGSWLKCVSARVFFRPLDSLYKKNTSFHNDFYPRLLSLGNVDGKQYLLPVSFNAPMVIFARDKGGQLSSPFTIGFDEMKKLGKNFNAETRGVYTKMGFSPSWDDNFLYITAALYNASFREADPVAWDSPALEQAMSFTYDWVREANTSIQAVDDFTFKYFYNPPAKLALSGRILFTCMDSGSFFILAEDQQNNLDFRWLAEGDSIPLTERTVYLGLVKKGKAPKAAEAFLRWFFSADTQRGLLEKSRQNRLAETSFGISGGFSAMRPVTEQVFPQFYQGLLGHMPPAEFLSPANVLPINWMTLKERVILPYLHDRARQPDSEEISPLERRLADWLRINR